VNAKPPAAPDAAVGATRFARVALAERAARRLADALSDRFEGLGVAAFEDDGGAWQVEVHALDLDEGALRRAVAEIAGAEAGEAMAFGAVAPQDWVAASLAGLRPVAAGRFLVHGGHDRAAAARARIPIEIEAALAFGTGHHGTTRGCLLAFDRLLRASRPRRILDVGTGTGVLAIAAAKALRAPVVATDIDPVAVAVARENARLNHVAPLVETFAAPGVASRRIRERAPYDLVFANILLPPLRRLAAPLAPLLAPDARVILSGLLPGHVDAARAAYAAQGLALERRTILDGWATLVMRRGA